MEKAWTFKNYWAKEALNIMYRAICIWGLGPSLKNVWLEGIPVKIETALAKQHDIDYAGAKNLQDKWIAHAKMIESINKLPGKKTLPKVIRKIMKAKKRLKL